MQQAQNVLAASDYTSAELQAKGSRNAVVLQTDFNDPLLNTTIKTLDVSNSCSTKICVGMQSMESHSI